MSVSLCRLSMLIDAAFGKLRQGCICLFFLGQGSLQQLTGFIQSQFLSPGLQRPVARDFVMLDRLGGRKQTRVQSRATPILLNYLLPFLDDADNGVASLAARRLKADELPAILAPARSRVSHKNGPSFLDQGHQVSQRSV